MKRLGIILSELLILLLVIGIIGLVGWSLYTNSQISSVEDLQINSDNILNLNGYNIHVQQFGTETETTPVIILHGFDPSGNLSLEDLANEMSGNRLVILPDLLGFGFSERVTEAGDHYSYAGQASLVLAIIDSLGIQEIDIIGHDYGAAVAAQFALDYPQRVNHLVLISADIYPQQMNVRRIVQSLPLGIGRSFTFLAFGGASADLSHESPNCINCSINPRNQYVFIEGTTDALLAVRQSSDQASLAEQIPNLTVPVSVIWGNDDPLNPISLGEQLIEETQAQETIILDDSAHYPYLDNLGEIVETVEYFFSQ